MHNSLGFSCVLQNFDKELDGSRRLWHSAHDSCASSGRLGYFAAVEIDRE